MNRSKRILALISALVFIFSSLSPTVFAGNGETESFYLIACTEYETIIEPVPIYYTSGQSVQDALLESDYSFEGLGESGFIETIEGVAGNFVMFYDSNGFDLSVPASSISVLCFTEVSESYSPELIALVYRLGQFREMDGGVQVYAASQYSAALRGVQMGVSGEQAQVLLDGLNAAISAYEELIGGDKYTVSFDVLKQDTSPAESFTLKLTDAYGNVSVSDTSQIQVIAGEYDFIVTSGYNRTEGYLSVGGNMDVSVTLPSSEWYGNVRVLHNGSYVESSLNTSEHSIVFYVDDSTQNVSNNGIQLYPTMGRGVPDRNSTLLFKAYVDMQGESVRSQVSWGSTTNSLAGLLDNDMIGNTAVLEAQYIDSNGYRMIQSYYLDFVRIPTLSAVKFNDAQGANHLSGFSPDVKDYSLVVPIGEYEIVALPYAEQGYEVSFNNDATTSCVDVAEGVNTFTVSVSHENGQSRTYTLNVTGVEASKMFFNIPDQTSLEVFTMADSLLTPAADGGYILVPGNEYYYVTTKDVYYHASAGFVAQEGSLIIDVAEPHTEDMLDDIAFYDLQSVALRNRYLPDKEFSPSTHEYLYMAEDAVASLYVQATVVPGCAYKAYARYDIQHNYSSGSKYIPISDYPVSEIGTARDLPSALGVSCYSQTITITLEKTEEGIIYSHNYIMKFGRIARLSRFVPMLSDDELLLYNGQGTSLVSFDSEITSYSVKVSKYTEEIVLSGVFTNQNLGWLTGGGYSAQIGERIYTDLTAGISIPLDHNLPEELISLNVMHEDEYSLSTTYTLNIIKFEPVPVIFDVTPQDATVFVVDDTTSKPLYSSNGIYFMEPGRSYTYTVTKNGYIGQQGSYVASESSETISAVLEVAPKNTTLVDFEAEWPYFRADTDNNGVVDYKTPIIAEDTVLYWATAIGQGSGSQACGCPIIVDSYLYVYASNHIYKVDTVSGMVLASGTMDRASSFAINSPAYAEGMIFVGLSDGGVQAFNADTLQSLWIYNDPIAAQPNCPIVYHDGYIYTGFWKGEDKDASFVCISVTDEDPEDVLEEKLATWRHVQKGGFYWAGAYVCDDYLLVGTDDGKTGYVTGHAEVLSIDPKNGTITSRITLPHVGDQRSSIMHDSETGDFYFTTKGGYFYRLSINADHTIDESSLRYVKLDNYKDDPKNPPMSTCTPVIYNGRAYIGVSGTGQFAQYSGHNITVIDLNSMRIAYKVRTQGYPQTSGLLTTAYDEGDGTVYVYFVDNMTPGKLRVISDKPGQYEPKEVVEEGFTDSSGTIFYDTAYVLFTPTGNQAEFAICSPIADETGTIYFKNDSGCLMAIGPTITSLEITEMPAKMSYGIGETFDPSGMTVTAHYSNGISRDMTSYITYSSEPLTEDDTEFEIRFEHVMYQNKNGETGVVYDAPSVFLELKVGDMAQVSGDINGDGMVDEQDVTLIIGHVLGTDIIDDPAKKNAADMNGDGYIDENDVTLLIQLVL